MNELIWFLTDRRKRLNITQEELAKRMNTTQSHISDLENQRGDSIALTTLYKWAQALDYPAVSIGFTNSRSHRLIPLDFRERNE